MTYSAQKFMWIFVCAIVLTMGLLVQPLQATDRIAPTCSQTDVQAQVNLAQSGDQVLVPAGSCTWTVRVTISGKNIVLKGSGATTTLITAQVSRTVDLTTTSSRVTGFGFIFGAGGDEIIYAQGQDFRVDHSKFDNQTGSGRIGVEVEGCEPCTIPHPTGLVDHNEFINNDVIVSGDSNLLAHPIWAQPSKIGNPDQSGVFYVEDNSFVYTVFGNVIDSNSGGRYVFRHNTVQDVYAEAHSVQGNHRSARSWEIYDNTFTATTNQFSVMRLRGGTGVVYNNVFTGPWNNGILLDNVRSFTSFSFPPAPCDGTSIWDGNVTGGWPCRDQIGRGQDTAGTFPQAQASEPAYFWNNKMNGANSPPDVFNCTNAVKTNGSCADIVAGRDFFTSASTPRPGYTAFTYPHPLQGIATDTTPPVAGNTGLIASSNLASTSVTLTWTKGTDDTSAQAALRYEVRRSTNNNINTVANAELNGTVALAYTTDINTTNITGLTASTAYFFTVIVKDEAGNKTVYGTTNITTLAPESTPPTPGNGGAISTSNVLSTTLTLNWTKATDNISAQSTLQYEVRRSLSNNMATVANAEANGTVVQAYTTDIASANITGLTASTSYFFNVIVKDEVGNKAVYTTVSQTTQSAVDTTAPVPGNSGLINISSVTTTGMTLSWSNATDNVTAQGSLQYEVRQATTAISSVASAELNGAIVQPYSAGLLATVVTNLSPGTTYYFMVIVKDAAGNKAGYSMAVQATAAIPDTQAPTVTLNSPADGAVIAGSVQLSATATDNVGVQFVTFFVNGTALGAAISTPPYSMTWNTMLVADGVHTLRAEAVDTTSNTGTSLTISVRVSNLGTIYTIPTNGGQSLEVTGGSNPNVSVSHGRITGTNPPDGTAIISYQPEGSSSTIRTGLSSEAATTPILISETGVPASAETYSGQSYVDLSTSVNTGIAIANETAQDAVIDFYFTDGTGARVKQGSFTVRANGQFAAFMDSAPFSLTRPFRGTFSFTSTSPVAAISTRGLTNERNDFVFSTIPITISTPSAAPLLPMFADGGGWRTQVVLTNPTSTAMTGSVQFFSSGSTTVPASAMTLTINGTTANTFSYSIPPNSMFSLQSEGTASTALRSGSVRVTPSNSSFFAPSIPNAFALMSFKDKGVTVTETSVIAKPTGTAFRMYVEASGPNSTTGQILSGMAVASDSSDSSAVVLELTKLDGTPVGSMQTLALPARGQMSKFINELFAGLPAAFKGVLRVTSPVQIGVIDLRGHYNSRGDFLITTIPPANEALPDNAAVVFPHIVSGGGYRSQIVLFGRNASTGPGSVAFTSADGVVVSGATTPAP